MIEILLPFVMLVIVVFVILMIAALPLYFAVQLLGGKATISKVILVNIYTVIIFAILEFVFNLFGLGNLSIVSFILLIYFYHSFFKLGWIKALIVWFLQIIVAVILLYLMIALGIAAMIGVSLL